MPMSVTSSEIRKSSLAVFLYLILCNPKNVYFFSELIDSLPLSGKVLVNQESSFTQISISQFKGVLSIIKNLKVKEDEDQKAWFIEIAKIFQEKNLRIFYMPFATLEKIMTSKSFAKVPDPKIFLVGVSFCQSGLVNYEKSKKEKDTKSNFKIYNITRKSVDPISENRNNGPKNFKFEALIQNSRKVHGSVRVKETGVSRHGLDDVGKNETQRGGDSVT